MRVSSLPSPVVLIEESRLLANLDTMAERAAAQGVRLRPHTKTHKSVDLARMQLDRGAHGITVAKVGEAEVFAAAGFDDIRLAYVTLGADKWNRLLKLEKGGVRISFCVDTPEGARAVAAHYHEAGRRARVLLEIDTGYHRCGIRWDATALEDFVRELSGMDGLELIGILTHAGNAYYGPRRMSDERVGDQSAEETREEALRRVGREERDRMLDVAVRLAEAGVIPAPDGPTGTGSDFEISIGSTPSLRYFENVTRGGFRITEIRPGNYVFHDATQVGLGVAPYSACALTVRATVISKHRNPDGSERLFLDAGKKVLTSDGAFGHEGFGVLLYNERDMSPLPHHTISALSEEHGWLRVRGGSTLSVGDTVRLVPNHACVVVNTQRYLYLVEGEEVLDTWAVSAQGRVV